MWSICIYSRNLIVEKGRRIGINLFLLPINNKIEACDINTMDDFMIADAIYAYRSRKKEENE